MAEHHEAVAAEVEQAARALVGEEGGGGDEGAKDLEGGLMDAAGLTEGGLDD